MKVQRQGKKPIESANVTPHRQPATAGIPLAVLILRIREDNAMTYAILITTAEGDNGSVERIPCETEQQAASLSWQKLEQYVSKGFRTEGMDNEAVYLTRGDTRMTIQRITEPKVITDTDARITELESELAAAIEVLRPLCEVFVGIGDMLDPEEDKEYIDICYNAYRIVTAWKARQPADQSTDAGLASIPPERAGAVALVQQQYQREKATLASRHEREHRQTEDWYLRAMNAALNENENGV